MTTEGTLESSLSFPIRITWCVGTLDELDDDEEVLETLEEVLDTLEEVCCTEGNERCF